jgi:hypothetical protein
LEFYYVYWCQQTGTHQQNFQFSVFKRFIPHARYSYTYALEQLKLRTSRKRKYHLYALVLNSVLPFWKLFVFQSLLGISKIMHCSTSVHQVKVLPLLGALQLLMFAERFTYFQPQLLLLWYSVLIKTVIVLNMNVWTIIFLTEWLRRMYLLNYYCLNDRSFLVLSRLCLDVRVFVSSLARAYFIIDLWFVK